MFFDVAKTADIKSSFCHGTVAALLPKGFMKGSVSSQHSCMVLVSMMPLTARKIELQGMDAAMAQRMKLLEQTLCRFKNAIERATKKKVVTLKDASAMTTRNHARA